MIRVRPSNHASEAKLREENERLRQEQKTERGFTDSYIKHFHAAKARADRLEAALWEIAESPMQHPASEFFRSIAARALAARIVKVADAVQKKAKKGKTKP